MPRYCDWLYTNLAVVITSLQVVYLIGAAIVVQYPSVKMVSYMYFVFIAVMSNCNIYIITYNYDILTLTFID